MVGKLFATTREFRNMPSYAVFRITITRNRTGRGVNIIRGSSEARRRVEHKTAGSKLKTDSPSNSLDVSHMRAKDFRYGHGSIGVLVLFDDRDQHSGARNRRVVQRITKT